MRHTVIEKSRRRLLILIVSTVLISVLIGMVFTIHQRRSVEQYKALRQKADHAMRQGDFKQAASLFSSCLACCPEDPKLLADFAQAQMLVGDQGQRYMAEVIDVLISGGEIKPQQDQAANTDSVLADQTQVVRIANRILISQPHNQQLLQCRTLARARLGQYKRAIADVDQCLALKPHWYEMYLLRLYLMKQMNLPADPFLRTVQSWQTALNHAGWYQTLMGVAYRQLGMNQQALNQFIKAQDQTQNDGQLLSLLSRQFEVLGEYDRANQLRDHADPLLDDGLLYQKAWHAWQNQQDQILLALPDRNLPQVLALQVMSLYRTKQTSTIQEKLSKFKFLQSSRTAASWEQLLGLLVGEPVASPTQIIEVAQQVRRQSLMPGLVNQILAEQWEKLGEQSCALDAYKRLAEDAPAWEFPQLRQARLLLAMGHPLAAAASARQAIKRKPTSLLAATLLIESLSPPAPAPAPGSFPAPGNVSSGNRGREVAKALLDEIAPKLSDETRIRLASRILETSGVEAQIKKAVKQKVHWSPQTWIELAQVSLARHANWHLDCLSEYKQRYGVDLDWLRLSVQSLTESGQWLAARQLLDSPISKQIQHQSKSSEILWLVAEAEFLTTGSNPLASQQVYQNLLKQYPNHLKVLESVLDAPLNVQSLSLRQEAIDQLHRLTGDNAVRWRYEQARLLLSGEMNDQMLGATARLLHAALKQSPSAIRCRLLLIQCLEEIGSRQGIHEQAQAILKIDPYQSQALALLKQASR